MQTSVIKRPTQRTPGDTLLPNCPHSALLAFWQSTTKPSLGSHIWVEFLLLFIILKVLRLCLWFFIVTLFSKVPYQTFAHFYLMSLFSGKKKEMANNCGLIGKISVKSKKWLKVFLFNDLFTVKECQRLRISYGTCKNKTEQKWTPHWPAAV